MSSAVPSVGTIQRWMQTVLVHPGGADAGIVSPEAERLVPSSRAAEVVRERGGLSAAERLGIYSGMFPLRMGEALSGDYPALKALLGDDAFERMVLHYVAAFPSRSYTLARLGDDLPGFLAGWGPKRLRGLLADVARLELAATRVFDAGEAMPSSHPPLRPGPPAAWGERTLVPAPAFAILRVRSGAVRVLDAVREGKPVPRRTGRTKAWVVFFRKNLSVRRRTLAPFAGRLLAHLAGGRTVGDALARTSRAFTRERPASKQVSAWFREWTSLGFFELPGGRPESRVQAGI